MRMSAQKLWMFSQREVHQLQAPPTLLTCILKLDLFFIGVSLTCWDRKASRCSQIWAVMIRSSTEGWFIFTDPFKTRWIAHKIFSSSWKRSCLLSLPLVWPVKPAGRESASLWEGHQLLTKHTLSSHSPLQVVPHRIIWTMKLGSVCVCCLYRRPVTAWRCVIYWSSESAGAKTIGRRRKMSRCNVDNWSKE